MKRLLSLLALCTTALTAIMHAQTPPQPSPFPAVPTTKILAVGRITGAMTPDARKTVMPNEVSDTVRLYLSGKIDQWYVRKDRNGVVFLLNVGTIEEAHALLEALLLGKAKLGVRLDSAWSAQSFNVLLEQNRSGDTAQSKSSEK